MPLTKIQSLGITDGTIVNADINASAGITLAKLSGVNDAKAWVNFNGTGTPAIRASFNVTSITDNGTASYTINFTTAMPDINYSVAGCCYNPGDPSSIITPNGDTSGVEVAPTTTAFRFSTIQRNGSLSDVKYAYISIFR
jgi:hypothetical protein